MSKIAPSSTTAFAGGAVSRPCGDDGFEALRTMLDDERLDAVFQPILDIRTSQYFGFEGLIRGPQNSPLHLPQALFAAAHACGMQPLLERAARRTIVRRFAELKLPGRLFINVSPSSLCEIKHEGQSVRALLDQLELNPEQIVLEITENEHLEDVQGISEAIAICRDIGFVIALDDLGEGFANLRMWADIHPEIIKIDRHFVDGIATNRLKSHFVRAMQTLAESCSALVVAEGIEQVEDLTTLRDIGIALAQGFLIERPSAIPCVTPQSEVIAAIQSHRKLLLDNFGKGHHQPCVSDLMKTALVVLPETTNATVLERFESDPYLHYLPVVQDRKPVGLIARRYFIDHFAKPFRYDLFAKKPCCMMMDSRPLCVNGGMTLQELGLKLSRSEKTSLEGFLVANDDGEYLGVASGRDLMAVITEMQILAARHSNPLTQLPGNVPINEQIARLLEGSMAFVACYVDINHFKPYNDHYGYARGDSVIQALGELLLRATDKQFDFVGHIGGDDFMLLFQSSDWQERCTEILRQFDELVGELVDLEDRGRSSIVSESRSGDLVAHPLPSLAIGAVPVTPGKFDTYHAVASAATGAKHHAKKTRGSSLFVERRLGNP